MGACQTSRSAGVKDVLTADGQRAMTPSAVVADLKAGNERFVSGRGRSFDYLT
jgi:hypothetical protein